MPNFHTHWLVAWQALDGLPGTPARLGRDTYIKAARNMARGLEADVDRVGTLDARADFTRAVNKRRSEFDLAVQANGAVANQVACFGAFMLGACGPDFWTLPTGIGIPWTAGEHFNLGHYNRTHQQFVVSVSKIGKTPGVQADMERSYFMGMATHIAADLVIHQLVNVYAGAYNLLKEEVWSNQEGWLGAKLWNTHNKLEHFWDTYIRFRHFGDLALHGSVFEDATPPSVLPVIGFPLVDSLRLVAAKRNFLARDGIGAALNDEATRVKIEGPLVFPMLGCDRILGRWPSADKVKKEAGTVDPFIYRRVVDKQDGAYPGADLYPDAQAEADHAQMTWNKGRNEGRKLEYFCRQLNSTAVGDPGLSEQSQNYFTYYVAPSLATMRKSKKELVWGRDGFYDLPALDKFLLGGIARAKSFAKLLQGAYDSAKTDQLGGLASFWNLDTGLGLEVQHVRSHASCEVITRLDFLHVLDERFGVLALDYTRPAEPATGAGAPFRYLKDKPANTTDFSKVSTPAFPVRDAPPPFADLALVREEDDGRYLDRIRLKGPARERLLAEKVDEFFDPKKPPPVLKFDVASQWTKEQNTLSGAHRARRLTLELRVPIATLGAGTDEPAAFLYCDDRLKLDQAAGMGAAAAPPKASKEQKAQAKAAGDRAAAAKSTHHWMKDQVQRPIFFTKTGQDRGPLRSFTARLLVNLEVDEKDAVARIVKAPNWNDVVPYEESKKFYGRNFAISTGRRFVLDPTGKGNFDPTTDFAYFANASPTEQVFLTIYPLVKTASGDVYDAFSREKVTKDVFQKTLRPISGLGWVKIVLLYYAGPGGALQLDQCFVDALPVKIGAVED